MAKHSLGFVSGTQTKHVKEFPSSVPQSYSSGFPLKKTSSANQLNVVEIDCLVAGWFIEILSWLDHHMEEVFASLHLTIKHHHLRGDILTFEGKSS